jgi:hypothetical protein
MREGGREKAAGTHVVGSAGAVAAAALDAALHAAVQTLRGREEEEEEEEEVARGWTGDT